MCQNEPQITLKRFNSAKTIILRWLLNEKRKRILPKPVQTQHLFIVSHRFFFDMVLFVCIFFGFITEQIDRRAYFQRQWIKKWSINIRTILFVLHVMAPEMKQNQNKNLTCIFVIMWTNEKKNRIQDKPIHTLVSNHFISSPHIY